MLLLLVSLASPTSRAQGSLGELRFEHITVREGLSHSDAITAAEDKEGFLWVGTNKGLNRYDGYELKTYFLPVNPLNGLSGNRIRVLHVSAAGRLWVGTQSTGVSCYDAGTDKFVALNEHYLPLTDQPLARQLSQTEVTALTSDADGHVWVGTRNMGLFQLTVNEHGQLVAIHRVPLASRQVLDYEVGSLLAEPGGRVWVGTLVRGLCVVEAPCGVWAALVAQPTAFPAASVRQLHLDRQGDLWVSTGQQVFWLASQDRQARRMAAALPLPQLFQEVQTLYLDSFRRLWVGTNYGLHLWPAAPATGHAIPLGPQAAAVFLPAPGRPYGVNSERVTQIFENKNQILWLAAAAGGLNRVDLRQKPFGHLSQQTSEYPTLANNFVNTIYKEEAPNLLWLGTRNGLSCYDLTRKTYRNYLSWQGSAGAHGADISVVFQSSNGLLWLGTHYGGLLTLQRKGGREVTRTYTSFPGQPNLAETSVEGIVEDRYGKIWVATFAQGLLQFDQEGQFLKAYRPQNSNLPTSKITSLLYDRQQDVLWASTRNAGLLKLRVLPDSLALLRQFQYSRTDSNSLQVNYACPLLLDRQGTLWIGTIGGGLHQLMRNAQGQETIRRYSRWLPETDIESLLTDEKGNLWIGGGGLYCFNPTTRQYQHYDAADGLQNYSFKVGSAHRSRNGTLYFGGINGISYFQPAAIQPNPFPPVVRITGLRLAGRPVAVGEVVNDRVLLPQTIARLQNLKIKDAENDFALDFTGLNYANPAKNRYAYQLEGYHDRWIQIPPGQRTASFANLPAGNYTLRVKASNGDGIWTRQPATLHLTVLPPRWRTWWAYTLYAGGILLALALYRRMEMRQQAARSQLALDRFQVAKEKEVLTLKLDFFTNVSHELRTPLSLILAPMEELMSVASQLGGLKDKVLLMHRQTRKLLGLVNQLLDFRKVESGHIPLRATRTDAVHFLTEIFLIFQLKAEERQIDYTLLAPPEAVPLYFDARQLEIVLTNLLANAFKYTKEGGKIQLTVAVVGHPERQSVVYQQKLQDNYLEIQVQDWGVGMKPTDLNRIFDVYYQASHTDTLRMVGTGIGLSLVKQLVERHAGEVTVQSQVGQGTTFTVRLPFGNAHLATADLVAETLATGGEAEFMAGTYSEVEEEAVFTPAPVLPDSAGQLLVVEDNEEMREYLRQLFEPAFDVTVAADGAEGWKKALAVLPDLVISDVMMPRGNGLELCQKIKQSPKTMHIPVLLLTARTAAMHEQEGLETGADDYCSKPFNPKLLQAKVASLLHNRHKLRDYYQRQALLQPSEVHMPDADKLFLENVLRIVEAHLEESEFTVPLLVREVGMSQSVFYRRLKSITGQSVVEFIRDVRMKRAAQLLADTHLRIAEVSAQVGIDDSKNFRKMFQKAYSMPPSEYAKQHRAASKTTNLLSESA
ncbi:hybrid sensor histidine kinase/response regulator transcription factor [Hymenobacter sp.]|uniref:hybrid sensor histidine kinase/response regulator transcription factor n=1 Tax=Hymenobacter sp. TaxID=1898978 RepID=UPI002ED8DF77